MERKIRASSIAWSSIALGVLAFDILCKRGDTLSERVDDWLAHENKLVKYGTYATIGLTALHLANLLPEPIDPFHQATRIKDALINNCE